MIIVTACLLGLVVYLLFAIRQLMAIMNLTIDAMVALRKRIESLEKEAAKGKVAV